MSLFGAKLNDENVKKYLLEKSKEELSKFLDDIKAEETPEQVESENTDEQEPETEPTESDTQDQTDDTQGETASTETETDETPTETTEPPTETEPQAEVMPEWAKVLMDKVNSIEAQINATKSIEETAKDVYGLHGGVMADSEPTREKTLSAVEKQNLVKKFK